MTNLPEKPEAVKNQINGVIYTLPFIIGITVFFALYEAFREYIEMKRHSEIGYIIAMSPPDLGPIAEFILKHHEWWNGQGYPLGLKGEEIPLECRILAVADAYDAMTSDRPYRSSLSQSKALAELKRCAGVQFDPKLVDKFVDLLKES